MDNEIKIAGGITLAMFLAGKKERKHRGPDEKRIKDWWTNGYQNWSDEAFKKRLRVKRETFNFTVNEVQDLLIKTPTPMKPEPTPPSTQLAICLYRLAHGCTFMTTGDLFGVAESTAHVIFIEVCKAIVLKMYDEFVYLPKNVEEWRKELENFL